ncbi:citrate synthase-like protein [Xylariales sp. PMI_506]|nr:citrate synthase-like protein [Xylariales sp. PMI_506]
MPTRMQSLEFTSPSNGTKISIPIKDGYIEAEELRKALLVGKGPEPHEPAENSQPLRIFDGALQHTTCIASEITFVDHEKGEIRYRGHEVRGELLGNYTYAQVMHLLIWGSFPDESEQRGLRNHMFARLLPRIQTIDYVLQVFDKNAAVFPMIIASMGAAASLDEDEPCVCFTGGDTNTVHISATQANRAIARTLGRLAVSIALIYCKKYDKKFTYPRTHYSLIYNFLRMIGFGDSQSHVVERRIGELWITLADHDMSNPTGAVLYAGSALADPMSALIAGIACRSGMRNSAVIEYTHNMLKLVRGPLEVPDFMEAVKENKARLYGYEPRRLDAKDDPRRDIIWGMLEPHRNDIGTTPLIRVAKAIDAYVHEDPFFKKQNLEMRGDVLGSLFYLAIGLEPGMAAAIDTLSWAPGALGHWLENLTPTMKMWRPQQMYIGAKNHDE